MEHTAGTGPEERDFQAAMRHPPTAAAVLTVLTRAGPAGMATGSVTSVSLDPEPLSARLRRGSRLTGAIADSGGFVARGILWHPRCSLTSFGGTGRGAVRVAADARSAVHPMNSDVIYPRATRHSGRMTPRFRWESVIVLAYGCHVRVLLPPGPSPAAVKSAYDPEGNQDRRGLRNAVDAALCQAVDLRGCDRMAPATRAVHDLVRAVAPFVDRDRRLDTDPAGLVDLIRSGRLTAPLAPPDAEAADGLPAQQGRSHVR